MLFNLAVDHVYNEMCDPEFANVFGYKLSDSHDSLLLTGFADDITVTSSSKENASRVVSLVQSLFHAVGLNVNPRKSSAIHLVEGEVTPGSLSLPDDATIVCIEKDTTIKYLGCTFAQELVFDDSIIVALTEKINNLLLTPLLNPKQKLNILNEFIFPRLTYQLQCAPLRMIPQSSLRLLDTTIRNSAKAIIGLPTHHTATAMIYASKKFRGLGLVRAEWEAPLQHLAIATKLSTVNDALFHEIYDFEQERRLCFERLGIQGESVRQIRAILRTNEFTRWTEMSYLGVGVKHFQDFPKANRFVYDRSTMSTSEWTAAIKLNCGYVNLVGVPFVQTIGGQAATLCRRCHRETETPAHVLGICPFNERLRIRRHDKIKTKLAELLRDKGYHCVVEAHCKDGDGCNRFVDILAAKAGQRTAFIVDPTIRWESNRDVGEEVQRDKTSTYESCVADIKQNYSFVYNKDIEVVGLWWGARGTVTTQVANFFDRLGLDKSKLPEMAESILVDSIGMLRHHINGLRHE